MNTELQKRIYSFIWGMGGFTLVAVATYLMNISDIREIDIYKLTTIVVTVSAGYIVNQLTKYLNKK